jgi:hypothetical protein
MFVDRCPDRGLVWFQVSQTDGRLPKGRAWVRWLLPSTVDASEFRDHRADTENEWSHGGTWLMSFVLPPKFVCDAGASAVGHMDLPFLVPVPAAGTHITVHADERSRVRATQDCFASAWSSRCSRAERSLGPREQ